MDVGIGVVVVDIRAGVYFEQVGVVLLPCGGGDDVSATVEVAVATAR